MKENIWAFGSVAGIIAIITGTLLLLFTHLWYYYFLWIGLTEGGILAIKILALIWITFAIPFFAGVLLFEKHRKRQSAVVFLIAGFLGLFFAVGFFGAAGLSIFAGYMAMKDHLRDLHIKRLGHKPIAELHAAVTAKKEKRPGARKPRRKRPRVRK